MSEYSTNEMMSVDQQQVTVVGVDLGKTWIEVCGQAATGKVRLTGKHRPGAVQGADGAVAGMFGRAGGMWSGASLGAGVAGVRSRGEVDGAAVCEAVRAVEQE